MQPGLILRYVLVAMVLAALAPAGPAFAQPRDHDRVRDAVMRGEIKPLADILEAVRGKLPGEIVGVEIERKNDRWIYEFRVVDAKGRLFDAYVDAASGEIQRIKEK